MAIKNIIAQGIGFTPGSVKFIPTLGLIASATASPVRNPTSLTLTNDGSTSLTLPNDGSTSVTI